VGVSDSFLLLLLLSHRAGDGKNNMCESMSTGGWSESMFDKYQKICESFYIKTVI